MCKYLCELHLYYPLSRLLYRINILYASAVFIALEKCFSVIFTIVNKVSPLVRNQKKEKHSTLNSVQHWWAVQLSIKTRLPMIVYELSVCSRRRMKAWHSFTQQVQSGPWGYEDLGPRRNHARDGLNNKTQTFMPRHTVNVCTCRNSQTKTNTESNAP